MRQVFLGASALLAVGCVCALLWGSTDGGQRATPARGSRVVGEVPTAPNAALPLARHPSPPPPQPSPTPTPKPEPEAEPEPRLGTPAAGRAADEVRPAGPRAEARSLAELDVFVNPQQLLAHGLIEQGRAVDGIVVTTSVSFSATRLPLGYTRSVLSPLGDYSYVLSAASTRAEPRLPAGMRARRPHLLRFPQASYTVSVDLHVKAQASYVRDALMRTFGYGEDARIPLARGVFLFGGEGGARAVRAKTLTILRTLHAELEGACVYGVRAVQGAVRVEEFQSRLRQSQVAYQPFAAQLERWVALPDQDLLDVYTGMLDALGEVDRRLRSPPDEVTTTHRTLHDALLEQLATLEGLAPKLEERGRDVLGY